MCPIMQQNDQKTVENCRCLPLFVTIPVTFSTPKHLTERTTHQGQGQTNVCVAIKFQVKS